MIRMRVMVALVVWLVGGASLLLNSVSVAAAEGSGNDRWRFFGELYLWGADIGGTSVAGDDIDISFSDLIDNLDFAYMGTLAAGKGKWTLVADLVYLDVEDEGSGTANIIGQPVKADVDLGLKGLISTLFGAYRVMAADTTSLNVLAGARHLSLEADLEFDLGTFSEKHSSSGHVWDGILGARGKTELSDKWYLTYYADVGTGDTELTWQARVGINYRFKKVDAIFGYRYLAWDFDDNDTFDDLDISGPVAGIKFGF